MVYKPMICEHDVDDGNVFLLVVDSNREYFDVWVQAWITDGGIDLDWAQYDYDMDWDTDVKMAEFQNEQCTDEMWSDIYDVCIDYLIESELMMIDNNGMWKVVY